MTGEWGERGAQRILLHFYLLFIRFNQQKKDLQKNLASP